MVRKMERGWSEEWREGGRRNGEGCVGEGSRRNGDRVIEVMVEGTKRGWLEGGEIVYVWRRERVGVEGGVGGGEGREVGEGRKGGWRREEGRLEKGGREVGEGRKGGWRREVREGRKGGWRRRGWGKEREEENNRLYQLLNGGAMVLEYIGVCNIRAEV